MSWTTVVAMDGNWLFLPDLVIATRETNEQVPLPETSAIKIIYTPDKDNAASIYRTTDPLSGAEGQELEAGISTEDLGAPGNSVSLRSWFVKGTAGHLLEVEMIN